MALNACRRRDRKRAEHAVVYFNGEDVTARCYYVDARRGIVRLYKLNAEGRKYVEFVGGEMRAAREELRGRVRMGRRNRKGRS